MTGLGAYHAKRDFKATPEPKGRARKRGSAVLEGPRFVVQKHDARRLHYDFRLEMDGVLRSWAVTRGPSLVAGEKRLAVHVEDHPLEYGDFEGTIPKGEYGGGTVIVWDRGRWTPIGDPQRGYAKGHLEFELAGDKLAGRWHLIRMSPKPREKRENWLLIKADDGASRDEDAPDILEERPESAKTGRLVAEVAREPPGWSSKTGRIDRPEPTEAGKPRKPAAPPATRRLPRADQVVLPDFVPPALATLAKAPPAGAAWVHEIKFDGYRLQARLAGGTVTLLTRTGLDWTERFRGPVVAAFERLAVEAALIDGELVVEAGSGASDFSALQADLSEGRSDRFVFYAFDLLHLDGRDLRALPLLERKAALEPLIGTAGPLRVSRHFGENGALVLRHACRLSLEGVVSKRVDAPYRSGRTATWVKSKCSERQEFVVGGFVPSTVTSDAIGSLILGVFENGALRHVGRVGTGFSAAMARELYAGLKPLQVTESPFGERLTAKESRQARWVRPERVAEVEFRAWSGDGHLRHASFRGLREDKPAGEIVRETPRRAPKTAERPPRRRVALTHPDRIYWPDAGVTKAGLADYYAEVWRWAGPGLVGRPLALLRCPDGIDGPKFFQKHAWRGINPKIRQVQDPAEPDGEAYLAIDDLDGMIALVQSAALEVHPWGATLRDWERPDRIVMDLDPGDGVAWAEMIAAAEEVRQRLGDAGLAAFVKTSGGKGLHVVAPLKPTATWLDAKGFAKAMADAMATDAPDRFVATVTMAKRKGRIFVDYLRNQRGATAVAAYSSRARSGAPVSMPVGWDELAQVLSAAHFTVENAPSRLAALTADPWADFWAAAAPLPDRSSTTRRRGQRA
jgi:bifunctional non-homologous end joining protein LigD